MLVIVNPSAGGGRAMLRWQRVAPRLRAWSTTFEAVVGHGLRRVREEIQSALSRGETQFVAAGGDGTVNLVAGALAEFAPAALERVTLGAVGLGSSNDFHKPRRPECVIEGIPTRLDFKHAEERDLCAVRYEGEDGRERTLYWIVNSSVGITAEANWLFNHPGRWLALLKRASSDAAIVWATVRTLSRCAPLEARLALDGAPLATVRLRNLGVVKNPNFAGALRYDSPFEPASGDFHVHMVHDVPLGRLLGILGALSRGRFAGLPGTRSVRARHLTLSADRPFALEGDGEVIRAVRATFSLLPRRLKVCRP